MFKKILGIKIRSSKKHSPNFLLGLIFFSLLVTLAFPTSSGLAQTSGTNYYVSPSGNDGNVGSQSQPWKTIYKASSVASAGDTVYLRSGTYSEVIEFYRSGEPNRPITFMAYPGETPVIDGNNYTIPAGEYNVLWKVVGNYVTIRGLEIRYSGGMGLVLTGDHNIADQINAHHNEANGILIMGDYNIVENSRVWSNCMANVNASSPTTWASGLSAARSPNYAIIRNNEVYDNWGEGLSTYEANGTLIEDNIVYDNFSANLYISDATNVTVQRNFVYVTGSMIGSNQSGILMGDEKYNPPSANITIINNIIYGTHGNFHWWQGVQGGGMNNVLIAYNSFINGTGNLSNLEGGVIIRAGAHVNVRFYNNIIQQDGVLPVIATENQAGVSYLNNLWSKSPNPAASSSGDIVGDPRFSKTGSQFTPAWFQLSSTSPAIDRGTQLPSVTTDYFNELRGSVFDIGAHEHDTLPPILLLEKIFIPMIKK